MNGMVDILVLTVIVLSALLVWLLMPRKKSLPLPSAETESLQGAKHFAYFPQIRQSLSASDSDYLLRNAPRRVARRALRERRAVARRFLGGLREDFANLDKVGRMIAALSPEVSRRQETERLALSIKFQMLYALVWLRLSMGMLPLHQLESLADFVGRLATRIDETMAEINALSAARVVDKLNA